VPVSSEARAVCEDRGTGVIPAVMYVLAELDQTQADLQSDFPSWRIWYVYRVAEFTAPGPAILKVVTSHDGDVSKVLEDINATSPPTRRLRKIPRTG
jgi:hypothetical protein